MEKKIVPISTIKKRLIATGNYAFKRDWIWERRGEAGIKIAPDCKTSLAELAPIVLEENEDVADKYKGFQIWMRAGDSFLKE